MIEALYIGATGLSAQQTNLEATANNLVNMNTPGYKRSQAIFADLMYQEANSAALFERGHRSPNTVAGVGLGTRISTMNKVFTQGELKPGSSNMDLAINGEGWVEAQYSDGRSVFSRLGTLRVNEEGLLSLSNGVPLYPPISIPQDMQNLLVTQEGKVLAEVADNEQFEVGQIELAFFNSPEGLKPLGDNLYRATEASGEAQFALPGEEGRGVIVQNMLEGSNVQMSDELVQMMMAQRAFETSAKVMQAADEMLAMANNLRKT